MLYALFNICKWKIICYRDIITAYHMQMRLANDWPITMFFTLFCKYLFWQITIPDKCYWVFFFLVWDSCNIKLGFVIWALCRRVCSLFIIVSLSRSFSSRCSYFLVMLATLEIAVEFEAWVNVPLSETKAHEKFELGLCLWVDAVFCQVRSTIPQLYTWQQYF